MGCNSSKGIDGVAVDVYKPPPSSFAVFDVNGIQEPWLIGDETPDEEDEKPTHVHNHVLEKLKALESNTDTPQSWEEVSKVLENLKPSPAAAAALLKSPTVISPVPADEVRKPPRRKSFSFHTLEELEKRISKKPDQTDLKKNESTRNHRKGEYEIPEFRVGTESKTDSIVKPSLRNNIFIVKDRLEKEQEGKTARFENLMKLKRDPLAEFPNKCPPGGENSVVVYTTSLRGIRKTFDDCQRVTAILECHRVVFDERDVSLHSGFLGELKEVLGEEVSVPRLFVNGRYLGAAEEVVELNESGRLGRILSYARVERGAGRQACEGCGGARFIPCLDCGGSCKVVIEDKKERCGKCNENGLAHCRVCF